MMDVMYFGYDHLEERAENKKAQSDFIAEVKAKFPNVTLKDAYDQIKGFRQEVHMSDDMRKDYYSWLIAFGWFNLSLTMNMLLMDERQKAEAGELIELAKSQYPDNFVKG